MHVVVVESPLFHSKASVDKHWLSFFITFPSKLLSSYRPLPTEKELSFNYQVMQAIFCYITPV